ncbi:TRAP transporter large permease [Paracoccus sp. (in: a-proteobacteria)]|uniref:TRAP transporter large permease n=1 Tax=Paracoccus sp. TaxID=267 RepID=UPI002AFF0D1E|nr:TRAP transporter large permease [Paracoccus sp. (in: a-proteobacteria)]
MEPITIGIIVVLALLSLLTIGVPVGLAMSGVSLAGMAIFVSDSFMMTTAKTLPFAVSSNYAYVVVPMFILMGTLTAVTGTTSELYTAAHRWTSGMRGGLYFATTLAAGGFGAINGSTVVSSSLFTRIALPEMLRFGYPKTFSAGCIAASGTFAALIPPSLAMVIYGLLTNESVGRLLMAGLLPGLLTIAIYFVGIAILVRFGKDVAPMHREKFTLKEKMQSLRGLWAILILVVIVMGGIYSGVMFPSAAGAAGAGGALLIGLIRWRLSGQSLWQALIDTLITTGVLFLIIIGGLFLSRLLLVTGFVREISSIVTEEGISPVFFIVALVAIYIVLGMFLDGVSMMVMTIPFIYPVAMSLGMDPIWFAVLVIKLVEIGAITPPVGLNLFAVIAASDGKINSRLVFRGILPFLVLEIITLSLIIAFPAISTWLPNMMYG